MAGENYNNIEINFSVTNPVLQDEVRDNISPFSFLDFITYSRVEYAPEEYSSLYTRYLKLWYSKQDTSKSEQTKQFKDTYRQFMREVVVNYTTESEKRFLQKINFEDPADLDIAIPFFANKLKDIALFYKKKRDEGKYVIDRNKVKGSTVGVEKAIFDNIYNLIITADDTLNSQTYNIDTIASNLNIDIEEYIDVYGSYFDLPRTSTDTGVRDDLYSSNINNIDAKYWLDPDAIDALTATSFLEEIRAFSINPPKVTAETFDNICDPDNPFAELVAGNTKCSYTPAQIYALKRRLLEKYVGTDIYYINTSTTPSTSGLLVQADNPTSNLLNLQTADTATVESNEIRLLRDIGLFFEPDNIGLFKLNAHNFTYNIDTAALEDDQIYIFPDPELYGNVSVNPQSAYPVTFKIDNRENIKNVSSGLASGDPYITNKSSTFEPYNTKERESDELLILNDLSHKLNFTDLYEEGAIAKYQFDPYGNEYALFKEEPLQPQEAVASEEPILNLTLNGHTFFDNEEGYNFNYDTVGTLTDGSIRSGISTSTNGLTAITPGMYLYFREFTPYQEQIEPTRNIKPIFRDGGAFTFLDETLLPEPLSSAFLPGWPGPSNYYYTIFAEATFPELDDNLIENQQPLADIITEEGFLSLAGSNNYAFRFGTDIRYYLSAGDQYKYYDGGNFTDNITLKNAFDYAENKQELYIDTISNDSTTVASTLCSRNIALNNEDRRKIAGKLYVKNQRYSTSEILSSQLSNILSKYSNSIQYDINHNTIDFDIINDCIFLQTPSTLLIDKITYNAGNFNTPSTKNTLFTINSANKLNQFSNRFYIEGTNNVYFTIFKEISSSYLTGEGLAKNYWYIVPNIYEYNTRTSKYSRLYPTETTEQALSSFRASLSGTANNNFAIDKVQTPYLAYNKLNNLFKLTYIINDLNELTHIYDVELELNNREMTLNKVAKYNTLESSIRSTTFGESTRFATISTNGGSFTVNNFNLTI